MIDAIFVDQTRRRGLPFRRTLIQRCPLTTSRPLEAHLPSSRHRYTSLDSPSPSNDDMWIQWSAKTLAITGAGRVGEPATGRLFPAPGFIVSTCHQPPSLEPMRQIAARCAAPSPRLQSVRQDGRAAWPKAAVFHAMTPRPHPLSPRHETPCVPNHRIDRHVVASAWHPLSSLPPPWVSFSSPDIFCRLSSPDTMPSR